MAQYSIINFNTASLDLDGVKSTLRSKPKQQLFIDLPLIYIVGLSLPVVIGTSKSSIS